jgi:hypothetical protein
MDQTQLIKALVKVLREDIKKTLKEEIRNAVHEVLNEQVEAPKKMNESYEFKSKDDGTYGTIQYGQKPQATRPMITPADLGYGDNFREYSQPEPSNWGGGNEELSSYMQGQEEGGGIPLEHKLAMAARRNPEGANAVMKAMTRDYSQLVKKFK